MIWWELFIGFLEVGCFSFGGAYAAIPLIRDVVLKYGWLEEETLLYFIGVCESTPGPIMINLATYVGSSQAGILGGLLATFAVVLPAFLIILGVVAIVDKFLGNPWVKAAMERRSKKLAAAVEYAAVPVYLLLLIWSISYIMIGSHNPFIYFNF